MIYVIPQLKIVNSGTYEFEVENCKSFSPSLNAQISWLKRVMDGPSEFWLMLTGVLYQAISG